MDMTLRACLRMSKRKFVSTLIILLVLMVSRPQIATAQMSSSLLISGTITAKANIRLVDYADGGAISLSDGGTDVNIAEFIIECNTRSGYAIKIDLEYSDGLPADVVYSLKFGEPASESSADLVDGTALVETRSGAGEERGERRSLVMSWGPMQNTQSSTKPGSHIPALLVTMTIEVD